MDLNAFQKLVLFGGSFDPPHIAHVILPTLAMQWTEADLVVYIPSGIGPFKRHANQTPAHHRLQMLRLAIEGIPDVEVLTDEIDRITDRGTHPDPQTACIASPPTYTVDTLEKLRQRLDPKVQLRLLVGADHLRTFDQWHRPQRVIELAEPLVMVRPPQTRQTVLNTLPPHYEQRVWADRLVDVPQIDISSSHLRHLASQDKPLTGWVSPKVEAYIQQHGLYRDSDPS